ncbi:MAG TPA: GntR family transcriptional regulator [Ramlibacter sp.]|uniref:GntR family transcriptional regulator n=1 Tax=Ramlibacter sp. TaxID=1917967 RepID=UPI002B65EDB3|nr:GntR family transcriptional regulator [Ramlibacter sp.]HVZ45426.1 GntR family transcriptional regulator [Ramlibacter sp.]
MNTKTLGTSDKPLYLQLSDALEQRIDEGEFQPGDKLPGDFALSEEYGISVITARAAMRVLIDKLKVVRYPGKGTFVRKPDGETPVWGLGSMFDLVLIGLQTKLVLLDRSLSIPPAWAAKKFGRSANSKLYVVRTARESQGERFSIADVYYHPKVGELMDKVDFEDPAFQNQLMITVLQEKTGIVAHETYQTITAEICDEESAKAMGVNPGDPLLVLDRDYYDESGNLVQAARTKYRVDHYQYRISFSSVRPPSRLRRRTLAKPASSAGSASSARPRGRKAG